MDEMAWRNFKLGNEEKNHAYTTDAAKVYGTQVEMFPVESLIF
jgi:hypothetical protein